MKWTKADIPGPVLTALRDAKAPVTVVRNASGQPTKIVVNPGGGGKDLVFDRSQWTWGTLVAIEKLLRGLPARKKRGQGSYTTEDYNHMGGYW